MPGRCLQAGDARDSRRQRLDKPAGGQGCQELMRLPSFEPKTMKQHVLKSIKNHPLEWAGCAAIAGWLLSRIPAHQKRAYIDSSSENPVKRRDQGSLDKVWREAWQFSKPMIAAYLAKLLAEHAKSPENK
jgi:hypothetical protein